MNTDLKHVIQLATIDQEIDSFVQKEEQIKGEVSAMEVKKIELQTLLDKGDEELKEIHLHKARNETLLKDLGAKVKDIEKKLSQIKSEKELRALQIEEELAREQMNYTNDEIARFEKIEEAKKGQIDATKSQLDDLLKNIISANDQISGQMETLTAQRNDVFERKNKLMMEVSQKILSFYQKVRRWAGNSAVVPVKKQACMGCYMVVSDKIYSDVIKGDDIVTCPSCGRILHIAHDEAAAPQEA